MIPKKWHFKDFKEMESSFTILSLLTGLRRLHVLKERFQAFKWKIALEEA